jgi:hypothetical protein
VADTTEPAGQAEIRRRRADASSTTPGTLCTLGCIMAGPRQVLCCDGSLGRPPNVISEMRGLAIGGLHPR